MSPRLLEESPVELYIKEAREGYIEVIDLEYPEFMFVLEGIDFKEVNGKLETIVENMSILQSQKVKTSIPDDELDEFLDNHSEKVMTELFDSLLNKT